MVVAVERVVAEPDTDITVAVARLVEDAVVLLQVARVAAQVSVAVAIECVGAEIAGGN